ncbi:ABC transporter permease [Cohaesibacter gelatinilyticus]|uniref:Iron complex transport system permease protein n=1 Tax=Cohaesibacter gelatinilyticus TaxID=372072 RepID=A0A285PF69_9HYPH|nr:iron chelate uptake ABC transporter family permease subunit [Cohaesibacter gelatinilyticus]SNZ20362.1 iron complex transport system permease protein [Cohaesibacter gelatinilyticus]
MRKGWFVAVPLLLFGVVASLFIGVIDVSPAALFSADRTMSVMAISRIPRTVAIILTGSSMAVAGLIMQMIVANRFVEPMTAGSGSSAALGVLLVTFFMPAASIFTKMLIACLVALAGTAGFLMLVRRLPPHQPLLVPLVGIAYGGVIGAIVTFIGYQTDLLQYIEVWFNGEFSGILQGRYELLWLAGILTLLAYFVADQFAILGLGKNVSINLGLNYQQIVRLGLLIVSLITAMTVVTVGMIPFVGLVVPNIISRWLGDNLRQTLPVTALMGACLVLVSDLIGRLVRYPFEIPVGTIFGIVGAVIFLWILYMPATTKRGSNSDKREASKC